MTRLATLCRRLAPPADHRTDGELLAAFLHDQDEPAFAEIVRRHGPLVWGVCRRMLPDRADAEDAFQAVFLVLVRRAGHLGRPELLANWLYGVAFRTARNLRRRNARRLARRVALPDDAPDPAAGPDAGDLAADIDAALLSLPEKYRTPLILCHLLGFSRRDAAERLRVPEGTLSSLLNRGLEKLRYRLPSHDPVKALAAGAVAVPAVLLATTARAAAAAKLALGGAVSASVSQLVEGVLHMFWVQKATAATLGLVVVFGFGLGVGMTVRQAPRAAADETAGRPAAKAALAAIAGAEDMTALAVQLRVTEIEQADTTEGVQAAEEKLKKTAKLFADGYATATQLTDDADALKKLQKKLEETEKLRSDLRDKIKELEKAKSGKARGTPSRGSQSKDPPPTNPAEPEKPSTPRKPANPAVPQPPKPPTGAVPPTPPALPAQPGRPAAAANPFRTPQRIGERIADPTDPTDPKIADEMKALEARLRELEAMQQKLQADREKMRAEAERIRAQAREEAARQREREREKAREPQPRREPQPKPGAATGGHLEVIVGGDKAWWPCWVKEYGPDGKAVGSVICDSTEILARTLSRIAKDEKAPKDVRVSTQPGAPSARTKAVMDACQAAGFRQVRLTREGVGGADIRLFGPGPIQVDPFKRENLIIRPDGLRLDPLKKEDLERIELQLRNVPVHGEAIREQVERSLRAAPIQRDQAIRALEEAERAINEQLKTEANEKAIRALKHAQERLVEEKEKMKRDIERGRPLTTPRPPVRPKQPQPPEKPKPDDDDNDD